MKLPQEIIRAKRDGESLPAAEIAAFIDGLTSGAITEGQAAAFAMAVFFRGMNAAECAALTQAMTASGDVLDWRGAGFQGPVLDKHSTGGVGDNVSLVLAPAVAACGGYVPMISGRGLGHTGGTLDKLESLPGYDATPDVARLRRVVRDVGCAIIGQTSALAPADRRLYAIRDVTATVESIPLITASILSKKLAAGLQGLVMDVKTGSGAFMPDRDGACALARTLAEVARHAGLPTISLLTDMDQPLASAAGNALETAHALAHLTGTRREARLHDVVCALGAEMLAIGGLARDAAEGRAKIEDAVASGRAAEYFARMVAALGGPKDVLRDARLPAAPVVTPVPADRAGFVARLRTRDIGLVVVELGGGRRRARDAVDPRVGLTGLPAIGQSVARGDPIGFVHAAREEDAARAAAALAACVEIADAAPAPRAAVLERID